MSKRKAARRQAPATETTEGGGAAPDEGGPGRLRRGLLAAGRAGGRGLRAAGAALRAAWRERNAPPLAPSGPAGRLVPALALIFGALIFAGLCAAVEAERLARAWTAEFGAAATLMAAGPPEGREARFEAALEVLRTTPGIAEARPLPAAERRALLAPWLGPDEAAPADPPPMAAVTLEGPGPDPEMLSLRLQAEAPGAVYDDHAAWRGPLLRAAASARGLGWGAAAAAAAAGAAAAGLTAHAWTAGARGEQRLLRGMGAPAARLRRAWAGRAAALALLGAAAGAGLAGLALRAPGWTGGTDPVIAPQGWVWAWAAAVAGLLALAAWAGARLALRPVLRGDEGEGP
ncbi:MAG: cell division protein FtsX [Pseudomonadota bacterium]